MKKIMIPVLAAAMMLGLTACGGGPETSMSDSELDKKAETYQLNYSDEDIQAAIAVAQQYYADLAAQPIDPNVYMEHEIEEMTLWMGWLCHCAPHPFEKPMNHVSQYFPDIGHLSW